MELPLPLLQLPATEDELEWTDSMIPWNIGEFWNAVILIHYVGLIIDLSCDAYMWIS